MPMLDVGQLIRLLDESAASYDPACTRLAQVQQLAERIAPELAQDIAYVRSLLEKSGHPFAAVRTALAEAAVTAAGLSENLERWLLHGARVAGTNDPAGLLPFIEEQLTTREHELAQRFLHWVHEAGLSFGHGNLHTVYEQFSAHADQGAPTPRPAP